MGLGIVNSQLYVVCERSGLWGADGRVVKSLGSKQEVRGSNSGAAVSVGQ